MTREELRYTQVDPPSLTVNLELIAKLGGHTFLHICEPIESRQVLDLWTGSERCSQILANPEAQGAVYKEPHSYPSES